MFLNLLHGKEISVSGSRVPISILHPIAPAHSLPLAPVHRKRPRTGGQFSCRERSKVRALGSTARLLAPISRRPAQKRPTASRMKRCGYSHETSRQQPTIASSRFLTCATVGSLSPLVTFTLGDAGRRFQAGLACQTISLELGAYERLRKARRWASWP